MNMFMTSIVVMVTHVCTYVQTHQIVYMNFVQFWGSIHCTNDKVWGNHAYLFHRIDVKTQKGNTPDVPATLQEFSR